MLTQQEAMARMFLPATSRPELKDRPAIIQAVKGTERSVTNAQIENLIAGAIKELKRFGVEKGNKVVLCSENSPEFSSTILACWALNAMAILIDSRLPSQDLSKVTQKMGANQLVTSKNIFPDFKSQCKILTDEHIKVLEISEISDYKNKKSDTPFDPTTIDTKQPAFTILTSGTTGEPKAALHDLESLMINLVELGELTGLDGSMTCVMPLPISHIFGLEVLLVSQIFGTNVVFSELDPVAFIKLVHKHKPELIAGLPQFFGAMLMAPDGAINLSNAKLLLCGGAPLTVSLAEKFEKKFGKRLNNGYGSTESKIVALNKVGPMDSVGQFVKSAKIDIVNERDEVVPDGTTGEVRIAGPWLMTGYYGKDEETKKALHDGHYHTGDIGHFKDGNLFISGRMKEIVIVGGSRVYSGEVEEALRKDKSVREVAVVGLPHRRLGQVVKAIIVLNDEEMSAKLEGDDEQKREAHQQLRAHFKEHCKQNMRREMRPMKWEFRGPHDTLPKTLAGKIDKKSL